MSILVRNFVDLTFGRILLARKKNKIWQNRFLAWNFCWTFSDHFKEKKIFGRKKNFFGVKKFFSIVYICPSKNLEKKVKNFWVFRFFDFQNSQRCFEKFFTPKKNWKKYWKKSKILRNFFLDFVYIWPSKNLEKKSLKILSFSIFQFSEFSKMFWKNFHTPKKNWKKNLKKILDSKIFFRPKKNFS